MTKNGRIMTCEELKSHWAQQDIKKGGRSRRNKQNYGSTRLEKRIRSARKYGIPIELAYSASTEEWLAETDRKRNAIYAKAYREANPLVNFIRSTLQRIENATGEKGKQQVADHIGYTQEQFIEHLEKQFIEGMSWSNRRQWHIDHIVPIVWFLRQGETDIKVINALGNIRPVWAEENLKKGSKLLLSVASNI